LPQQTRFATSSAGISQQPAQTTSTTVTRTSKGKEIDTSEHPIMKSQLATSKEQSQEKVSQDQAKTAEILALQTRLNEERGKKREREEATPISGPAEQLGAKRQRLDPLSEEEIVEETIDSLGGEGAARQQTSPLIETSTSSHRQELERQHSVEVSSTRPPSKQTSNIKRNFTEIKARNDPLRLQIYNQYLKMAPTNQQRLMSAYDIKEGKMIMSYFKPKVQQPQSTADYIRTNMEVLSKDIHPMDQIELHKKNGEMVYSTLAEKAMLTQKLQNSLNNTSAQLDLEKASSLAKDNRIKSLEDIIIELWHDPKDAKGI